MIAPARRPSLMGALIRPGSLLVLVSLLLALPARGAPPAERLDLSTGEWREDLHALASQLQRRHANAFHHVTHDVFEREVARLDSALAGLDGNAVFARLLRLSSMVGDAHTYVQIPAAYRPYPLAFRRFGDELRVVRTTGAADSALGTRLVSIDDTPVAEICARLEPLLPQAENAGFREASIPGYLSLGGILRGIGVVQDERRARFTFADDRGAQIVLSLAPMASGTEASWHFTSPKLPLYRTKGRQPLAFTWLPESKTLYANFRSYEGVGDRAHELFEFLDQHPVDRLVIDLRQNGGGDFNQGRRHLIEPIIRRPAINRDGHLFALIGPLTFSAAMTNAVDFRQRTRAMLVGEPIGEKPNSYQEKDSFVLPRSHLQVSYSTKLYEFSPGKDVVAPDRVVAPTWEEFKAGRDPVLEWTLGCCR